jgi:hypothetical protein
VVKGKSRNRCCILQRGAEYRSVRRDLERSPQPPLTLRQVDTLICELSQYRDGFWSGATSRRSSVINNFDFQSNRKMNAV